MDTQVQPTQCPEEPISEQQQEVLLAEYDACLRTVHQLQTNIWQSAALFITLSTVGLSFAIQLAANTWYEQLVKVAVTSVPAIILAIWQRILNHWNMIQSLEYVRMSQIEYALRMRRQLYHEYAKNFNRGKAVDWNTTDMQPIDSSLVRRYGKRSTHTYISLAIWFLCVIWVMVAVAEGSRLF